jgi:hypothetical protein
MNTTCMCSQTQLFIHKLQYKLFAISSVLIEHLQDKLQNLKLLSILNAKVIQIYLSFDYFLYCIPFTLSVVKTHTNTFGPTSDTLRGAN